MTWWEWTLIAFVAWLVLMGVIWLGFEGASREISKDWKRVNGER